MEKFESGILEIIELSPSVKHLKIWVSEDFKFIPGQYISFIMEKDNKKLRRPYSISSSPSEKGYVDLCIKIVENGLASEMINEMQVNDKIDVLGPLGDFTLKNKDKDLIFISSGSGIGPFRSMIKDLLENNFKYKITLLTGYRSEEDILYDNEFLQLSEKHENLSDMIHLFIPFAHALLCSYSIIKYRTGSSFQVSIQDFHARRRWRYFTSGWIVRLIT